MFKKHMFSNVIFSRFFAALASQNEPKIDRFSHFFRKRRFRKNHCFPLRKIDIFKSSSLQKMTQNRCQNAFEKSIEKKRPKNRFWLPFWPPKTFQNRPNIAKKRKKKRSEKNSKKRASPLNANQRKASLLGPCRTIQLPFQ